MTALVGRRPGRSWERVTYGVWADTPPVTPVERLSSWSLALPDHAALTHLSAASAYGWWLPTTPPPPIFVALPERAVRLRRPGLVASRHPVPPDTRLLAGLRVVEPAEALLAAARDLAVLDLVVLVDCALAREDVTMAQLQSAAQLRRRGAPALRAVLPLADRRSESAWESNMRVLHRAADIPVTPQETIVDDDGSFVARVDLRIDGTRRVHEYDGDGHLSVEAQQTDLSRGRDLSNAGWDRHGFTERHLLNHGAKIIRATDRLLGRTWDIARFRAWEELLNDSALRRSGWERLRSRWGGS